MTLAQKITDSQKGTISDLHSEYGVHGDFVLTKYGSLIGAITLSGLDAEIFDTEELNALSNEARDIYQQLPPSITITQYYTHLNNVPISLKERTHPIADKLSRNRQEFLNFQKPSTSRLVHYFEIASNDMIAGFTFSDLCKYLAKSVIDGDSRKMVSKYFQLKNVRVCFQEELERQHYELSRILKEVITKYKQKYHASIMDIEEIWQDMCFLSRLARKFHDNKRTYVEGCYF